MLNYKRYVNQLVWFNYLLNWHCSDLFILAREGVEAEKSRGSWGDPINPFPAAAPEATATPENNSWGRPVNPFKNQEDTEMHDTEGEIEKNDNAQESEQREEADDDLESREDNNSGRDRNEHTAAIDGDQMSDGHEGHGERLEEDVEMEEDNQSPRSDELRNEVVERPVGEEEQQDKGGKDTDIEGDEYPENDYDSHHTYTSTEGEREGERENDKKENKIQFTKEVCIEESEGKQKLMVVYGSIPTV